MCDRRQGGGTAAACSSKDLETGLTGLGGAAACAGLGTAGPTRSRSASMSCPLCHGGRRHAALSAEPGFFWSGAAAAAPPGHVRTVPTAALRCKATSSCTNFRLTLGPVAWALECGSPGTEYRTNLACKDRIDIVRACRSSRGPLGRCRPGRRPRGRSGIHWLEYT